MNESAENTIQQNLPELIKETINSIFSDLFSSIDNSLYSILDDITFIKSDIITDSHFQNLFALRIPSRLISFCQSQYCNYYTSESDRLYLIFSRAPAILFQLIFQIL